jgi:Transposase DDE domain
MPATPFFPALRARLATLGRDTTLALRQLDFLPLCEKLRDLLPLHLLASADEGPGCRDRIFSLRLTFEGFIWQVLKPGTSCQEVTRAVQALFHAHDLGAVSEANSGFIQARQRLPVERLERALPATARTAARRVGAQGTINGRTVLVADGSTTQLPDTAANREVYPQAGGQKPGCGFPLLKFLPLFHLGSGAILHVETSTWKTHDVRLLKLAWDALPRGDILLVDRAFGDYVTLAELPKRGVDVLARLHGARKVDFRTAHQRLGHRDALFQWRKGCQQSTVLTPEEWEQVPDRITVRILRFTALIRGRRVRVTLATTLLDPVLYPAAELAALYRRRWQLELTLRHLKTTMGMEQLRCKRPEMVRKELLAYLVAYNLIRCLMAEAVAQAGVEMERLSFKGTVDAVRNYAAEIRAARSKKKRASLWDELVRSIAADKVPLRPGRTEPRAVKRRPKPYPLLNKPRSKFKEIRHRSRYRKIAPQKIEGLT